MALSTSSTCTITVEPTQLVAECAGANALTRFEPIPPRLTVDSDVVGPTADRLEFTFRGLVANNCPAATNCGTITLQSTVGSQESRCVRVESLLGAVTADLRCPTT